MNDLLRIASPMVSFHVLKDDAGLYLMDGGFVGAEKLLAEALLAKGWSGQRILGIIVTHGHLDHILNVRRIARRHGAWIAAPRLDGSFYKGRAAYRGWARVGGLLETLGRPLLGFERFSPDRLIDGGDVIDVWGGLKAVHLPGHTDGHMGYFSESRRLLFCGDLFASHKKASHFPPVIFNAEPARMGASVRKALDLGATGVLPNHGDGATPEEHLKRLERLAEKLLPERLR